MSGTEGGEATHPNHASVADVSLREYLVAEIRAAEKRSEAHFTAMEKTVEAAFRSAHEATEKVDDANRARFDSFNEFNQRINVVLSSTVTRDAMFAMQDKLMAEISRNREDLVTLARRIDLREGQTAGTRMTAGVVVTVITIGLGVIGTIVVLLTNFATSR